MRFILALAAGAAAQTRISLTQAARQPTLTTDDVEQLLAVAQRPVTPPGLVIVERTELEAVWKSTSPENYCGASTRPRGRRRVDGVEFPRHRADAVRGRRRVDGVGRGPEI